MSSPSQRRGGCGHMMAGFDPHTVCARCRDKKKGTDPCVEKEGASCRHCNALTPEQLAQLSTPSYKIKKEKRDMKSSTPSKNPITDDTLSPTLVDPSLVTVMGVVDGQSPAGPSDLSDKPVEKRKKEEKKKEKKATTSKKPDKSVKSSHRPSTESTNQKLELMEQKWSDWFNRLEALLLPNIRPGTDFQCCQGNSHSCSTGQRYQLSAFPEAFFIFTAFTPTSYLGATGYRPCGCHHCF